MSRQYQLREACPVCRSPAATAHGEGAEFLRCSRCDLRYRKEVMVTNSQESWESDYYSNPRILEHHARRASAFHAIEQLLYGYLGERGRLLDVGCGIGVFLEIARAADWHVTGIEASATAANQARQRVRATIHHGDVLDFETAEKFDAVTCFDVLRSVPRPQATLERLFTLLRPGGVVMLRETNGHWQRRSRRHARRQSLAHQYAQQWPPQTMALALERAGFAEAVIRPSPVFLDGCDSAARVRLKRTLSFFSDAVYAMTRRVVTPNMLAVARRSDRSAQ